ncbi:MAG: helix-turn-helix domain-containing protein [Pseudomonadota bacterium]
MSGETTIRVVGGAGGRPQTLRGKTDRRRLEAMTSAEVATAARSDPDAPPPSPKARKEFRRITLSAAEVKAIRKRRGLSQAAFSARYALNLRTLQDWEQGRVQPDAPARAYLFVIDREPSAVEHALAAAE